jgi:hypothetical protein
LLLQLIAAALSAATALILGKVPYDKVSYDIILFGIGGVPSLKKKKTHLGFEGKWIALNENEKTQPTN